MVEYEMYFLAKGFCKIPLHLNCIIEKFSMNFHNGMFVVEDNQFADAPTIVFLHDSLGCVQLWRDFPKKLASATHCNLMMYDRLGYGQSELMPSWARPVNYMELEADILIQLLQDLNIKNPILFGHSDGGTIALLAAAKYPKSIAGVIVEAAHIFVEEHTLKGVRDAITSYATTNLAERLQKYHGDKVDTIFKAWTETWIRDDYRDWSIEKQMADIECPLLFIQGEHDEYGTLQQVEQTINKPKGIAEQYIIPDVGHSPHKEVPEMIVNRVAEFLAKNV